MKCKDAVGEESLALAWLRSALADFYVHDHALLLRRVGERALTFRLGHYLGSHVDPCWDVDAEYDRQGMHGAQKVRGKASRKHMQPDLVVHRRGLRGAANNLLFVEVKRRWKAPTGDPNDIDKVRDAVIMHEYQVAIALGLGTAGSAFSPTWTVFIATPRSRFDTSRVPEMACQAQAVFDDAELEELRADAYKA